MSYFKENYVDLRLPQTGKIRTTLSELNYYSSLVDEMITVSIGFKTDLGSIPSFLQWLFPKDGKAVLAYILHDYLYKIEYKKNRDLCDDILKEAMKVLETTSWRRYGVRAGLKVGGWHSWNKHRKLDIPLKEENNKIT